MHSKNNTNQAKRITLAFFLFSILLILFSKDMLAQVEENQLVKDQHAQIGSEKEESKEHTLHPDAQWYPDAGFGLFLHWGISSVRAKNISWPMIPGRPLGVKRIEDQQERERIINEMDYNLNGVRPEISPLEYWHMAKDFNPEDYHPEAWLKKVKEAGFSYVVLTAKHHEGFALWPSRYGNFNTKNFMGGKDLIRLYVEACRKVGLKVGLYYSGPDWYFDQDYMSFLYHGARRRNPEFPSLGPDLRPRIKEASSEALKKHQEAYAELVKGQVEELLTNYGKIDLIWFDGKPNVPNADQVITQKRIRELQPGIIINPRMHGTGDFITYERHLPEERPEEIRWAEFCNPWNGYWPYVERSYKSLAYILSELVTSRAWGINYLLGIGPMASGDLAPEAYENMQKVGDWMKKNHEAVYDVRPLPVNEESSVLSSANGNIRYLYLLPKFKEISTPDTNIKEKRFSPLLPNEDIVVTLTGVSEPTNAVLLADGRKLKYEYSEEKLQVMIEVPITERSSLVDVICITLQ